MSHQYNILPRNKEFILVPNTKNPKKAVDYINSYINTAECKIFNVDLSFMNILDACYVSTMCSAKHFIKYPDGKIKWHVSSSIVKQFTKDMSLGNNEYVCI